MRPSAVRCAPVAGQPGPALEATLAVRNGRPVGGVANRLSIPGGTALTNLELTQRLLAAMGADDSMVERVPDRKGHDRRYSLDISKIGEQLGYAPQVTLDHGLADTIEWYRAHPEWWQPLKDNT